MTSDEQLNIKPGSSDTRNQRRSQRNLNKEHIASSIMRVHGKFHPFTEIYDPIFLICALAPQKLHKFDAIAVFINCILIRSSLLLIRKPMLIIITLCRMNRRKADFKFAYKFLEDDV